MNGAMPSPRREFWLGARDELPILFGVAPFGMIFGALALQSGIPAVAAQAMSSIVFAGSSQFVAAQLVGANASALVIIMVVAVVNLRHALYSASIAPYLARLSPAWKLLLAYLLTDEAYAVAINRYQRDGDSPTRHWYLLGAGLTLWTCWQGSTLLGILIGARLPADWSLAFALPLTFIALVVPALKDRAAVAAALSAGIAALLLHGLPYKTWLVAAALIGIIAGMLAERRKP